MIAFPFACFVLYVLMGFIVHSSVVIEVRFANNGWIVQAGRLILMYVLWPFIAAAYFGCMLALAQRQKN